MRTLQTNKGVVVNTDLTDADAIAICRTLTDNDFAAQLVSKYDDHQRALKAGRNSWGLSENQLTWVHKLALESRKPTPRTESLGDMRGIMDLFERSRKHVNFPKIRLGIRVNGHLVRVAMAYAGRSSKYPGTLNVSDGGPWGNNIWYGRIAAGGEMTTSRDMTPEVLTVLRLFAKYPAEIAALHGRLHGHCCFCAIPLTDERSVAVGYGKICAQSRNLPYGDVHFSFDADPELKAIADAILADGKSPALADTVA